MALHLTRPAAAAVNPHHEQAEQQNLAWLQGHGLGLGDYVDLLERLERTRFSRLAAFTYPNVGPSELALVCNWITWLFLHDDSYCDDADAAADVGNLRTLHDDVLAVLAGNQPAHHHGLLLLLLTDLRQRMLAAAGPAWLTRFTLSVDRYLQSTRWEARNHSQDLVPPLSIYVKMRGFTGAMDSVYDFIELAGHFQLDPYLREHATLAMLRQLASNCVCWANDIFSVNKELLEHNSHNLVFVLRREFSLTLAEALERAVAMHDAELRAFEWATTRIAGQKLASNPQSARALSSYIDGLRSWVYGNTAWSLETPRYKGCLSVRGDLGEFRAADS